MGIGVYRIYVSHSWATVGSQDGAESPALTRLVAALDANTAFLYRIDRLLPEDLIGSPGSESDEPGAVRVAMTQSHVMLVPISAATHNDPATMASHISTIEQDLARSGFRRRIPILGVRLDAGTGGDNQGVQPFSGVDRAVDRVVDLEASELACTIQELAEEAAAERRQANAIVLARPLRDTRTDRQAAQAAQAAAAIAPEAVLARALPVGEIEEAYQRFVTARAMIKPGR